MTAQRSPKPEVVRGLHAKLVEVMEAITWIPKGGRNEAQRYDFTRQADVADKVRAALAAVKVTCVPAAMEVVESRDFESKAGGRQHFLLIRIEWTFTDSETGETQTVVSLGAGTDSGDKAPYKAMTGASKYAELLSFLIPTGDDPEKDDKPARAPRPVPTAVPPNVSPIRSSTTAPEPDEADIDALYQEQVKAKEKPAEEPWDYARFRLAMAELPTNVRPDKPKLVRIADRLFPTKDLPLAEPKDWKLTDREFRQLAEVLAVPE